jgi:hypothetical protein
MTGTSREYGGSPPPVRPDSDAGRVAQLLGQGIEVKFAGGDPLEG